MSGQTSDTPPMVRAINDPHLKRGCIGPTSLRHLATVLEGLTRWHDDLDGSISDLPCLRRIEMDGNHVVAHVSSGPAVGGVWFRFVLGRHGWVMDDLKKERSS